MNITERMVTISAPAIGIAVLRTISNGEIPDAPATAIMTPVMGETVRPKEVANCIGRIRRTVETPNSFANPGTRGANAKKGALPEPITIEMMVMKIVITTITAIPVKPRPFVKSIRYVTVPVAISP